jgi:hypothetical protein
VNVVVLLVVAVVGFLIYRSQEAASIYGSQGLGSQLGSQPPAGGADGSPQSINAANHSQTTTVGNSEQNVAHGLESAVGGVGGAAVCTYYGAGGVVPPCAKVGSYLGPKAVALGNFTTLKTVDVSTKLTMSALSIVKKSTSIGTDIANKGASVADRVYAGAGALPGPLGTLGKLSVAPVKVAADLGAKGAQAGEAVAGAITGGAKKAANAIDNGFHKVLGFL